MEKAVPKVPERPIIWEPQDRENGDPGPQRLLLTCPCDEILFGGARGGGKSDGILGDWLAHASKYGKNAKGIVFRQTLTELDELIDRGRQIFLAVGASYAESKKIFKFPGGSTLKMRFLERLAHVARYQGHSYTWMAIEEAGNWPTNLDAQGKPIQRAVQALRANLRSAQGVKTRLVMTANPGGPGHSWLKEMFVDPEDPGVPFFDKIAKVWRVFIPAKLEDNLILMKKDPDYEARLLQSGPPHLVRAWRFGDWNVQPEGAVFKLEKFKYYSPEVLPAFETVYDIWDTAFKIKQKDDYSAGMKFASTGTDLYVLDLFRRKVEFPELKRMVVSFASSFKEKSGADENVRRAEEVCIEDKASGQSLLQELRRDTDINVVPIKVKPGDDKVSRANSVLAFIEAGRVHLPKDAHWLKDFIEEVSLFPDGAHDDIVDVLVHGIRRFIQGFSSSGLMEFYRQQAKELLDKED